MCSSGAVPCQRPDAKATLERPPSGLGGPLPMATKGSGEGDAAGRRDVHHLAHPVPNVDVRKLKLLHERVVLGSTKNRRNRINVLLLGRVVLRGWEGERGGGK